MPSQGSTKSHANSFKEHAVPQLYATRTDFPSQVYDLTSEMAASIVTQGTQTPWSREKLLKQNQHRYCGRICTAFNTWFLWNPGQINDTPALKDR